MKRETDVLIVGAGAAGLYCALGLPDWLNVCMISKEGLEESDSFLAQGGICTLKNAADYDSYFEDTMKAGHYENNPQAVIAMIRGSRRVIDDLVGLGVEFERNGRGLSYTREGAHSKNRILHHGDSTGREITSKLLRRAMAKQNLSIFPNTCMLDILCDKRGCHGAVVRLPDGSVQTVAAKTVVWATGGVGGLFESTTNYSHLTGDAVMLALLHDIRLKDISYIQIHPTTLYSEEKGRRFLISESLRGEGAVLLNAHKERFTDELLPRDLLSQAIMRQMKEDGTGYVWLSAQGLGKEKLQGHFPQIYAHCLEKGYDMAQDPVPVTPAQHYFMGGVQVDLKGRTSMPGLYAVGEAACNGVHGKNRLASNSLLEALVFSRHAAEDIANTAGTRPRIAVQVDLSLYRQGNPLTAWCRKRFLSEINRKDAQFYDQWCNNEIKYG